MYHILKDFYLFNIFIMLCVIYFLFFDFLKFENFFRSKEMITEMLHNTNHPIESEC